MVSKFVQIWRGSLIRFALCLAALGNPFLADAEAQRTSAPPPAPRRPSIILILADDLGYGDLCCYGQSKIKTPSLDRLAHEGSRFTDVHAASTVCTTFRPGPVHH